MVVDIVDESHEMWKQMEVKATKKVKTDTIRNLKNKPL